MASYRIERRTILRGVAGGAVALPALEIMQRSRPARAAAAPRYYLTSYGGQSIGGVSVYPNHDQITPKTRGAGYETTPGLQVLDRYGVKGDVGIVSGLKIPWVKSGPIPPGGKGAGFHGATFKPQVVGMREDGRNGGGLGAPSSDQLVADVIAPGAPIRTLVYRVQPSNYQGSAIGNGGLLSWRKDGRAIDPTVSPRNAYQALFGEIPENGQAASLAPQLFRRRSVLDLVKEESKQLATRLSGLDRVTIERHFSDIRELELRIDELAKRACPVPRPPGQDPPVGGNAQMINGEYVYPPNAGYSNETLRGRILFDMVGIAFACDLARTASVLITLGQSDMNTMEFVGESCSVHATSHHVPGGGAHNLAKVMSWHLDPFCRLVTKLKETQGVDGKPLLDNTAMTMFFEGGWGLNPEESPEDALFQSNKIWYAHSTENMLVIFAGRAGGLKAGHHIHLDNQKHPAQVLLTAMNAVGVKTDTLGEVKGVLPELIG